jgi:FkbM family methyltransferase
LKFPFLINAYYRLRKLLYLRFELRDILDSYIFHSRKPQMTPYGFKLIGSHSIHHLAMQHGNFEKEESTLFATLFHQTDIFVDVGANIGFYACLARSVGKHVIAVEPLPKNLDYLFENLTANEWKDVEVFPLGLSDHSGFGTLYGPSSTGASLIDGWAHASKIFHRTISLSTLDILLGNRFVGKKLFIKIDVEGFEYSVLLGSLDILQMKPKPTWVVEICLSEYHPEGRNPYYEDTFNLFWRNGYQSFTADSNNNLILPGDVERWVQSGRCDSGTINYKFAPSEST